LYSRKFKAVSDHKPLTWIMSVKDLGSRLLRWKLQLEEYDYKVLYKPGSQNSNTDTLSGIGAPNREVGDLEEIDQPMKGKILHENHDLILRGHHGKNKT
jgi:hypothetical protein